MSIHISNKKVNDIHVGTKKVLTAWIGTDRVYLASTLSMLIKGYTEKSGDSLLSANTPFKFTGENLFDKDTPIYYYQYNNGVWESNSARITSDYIRIAPEVDYTMTINLENTDRLAFINYSYFDENKNWLGNRTTNGDVSILYLKTHTLKIHDIRARYIRVTFNDESDNRINIVGRKIDNFMLVKGSTAPTTYEPYHETFYNPTEGFSLNGIEGVEDTLNTDNGEHIVKFTNVDLGELDYFYDTVGNRFGSSNLVNQIKKPSSNEIVAKIMSPLFTTVSGNDSYRYAGNNAIAIDRNGALWITKKEYDNEQSLKQSMSGIIATIELATPQTYQKKPKTLPQWVKHVFDSSGKELEATITQ